MNHWKINKIIKINKITKIMNKTLIKLINLNNLCFQAFNIQKLYFSFNLIKSDKKNIINLKKIANFMY